MSQEFDNNVLDLVKEKDFIIMNIWPILKKLKILKKELPSKEKFYSSFTDRIISGKEYEHVLNVWKKLKLKRWKTVMTCI